MIVGIAGINVTCTRGAVNFTLGHVRDGQKKIHVENAFILSKVTTDMPVNPVSSISDFTKNINATIVRRNLD